MFSEVIKSVRKSCFLSQQAFAKEIGVSFSTVNRWETEKTMPNYKALQKIDDFCKTRGIDLNQKMLEDSND